MNGPSTPPSAAQIGEYTLLERIAVGGMAEVFRARRGEGASAEVVVLKRILPRVAAEAGGLSRFAEEARLGAYVDHPNVVRLLDAGLHREPPFLALEYVPGCDLWRLTRWLVREGRTLGVPLALHVVEELLRGLEAVHGARDEAGRPLDIVHRDVSPSNVLLSTEGAVKLGDFGIAKATLREERSRASLGAKGKIGYLAPEQVTGERPDQRADVFSAAVILAELLLGRPLFGCGSELAILLAIRDANVQPFLALELEAGLKAAVAAALAKDPAGRPASARAFMEALAPFQREAAPALRLELAGLVATATSVERARRGATDARVTVPAPAPDEPATPRVPEGSSDDARFSATTQRVPTQTYRVSTTDGARLGPWTFAQLVEALTTGRLGLEDEV
ncbi:MAG: serine/threonine-protein kinase, partial [Myxococcota bacterium]